MSASEAREQSGEIRQAPSEDLEGLIGRLIVERQLNRSGNTLLCGMDALTHDEFFAEAPNGVSPAWTVGHLACVSDLFISWLDDNETRIRCELHSRFNNLEVAPNGLTKAEVVREGGMSKKDIVLLFRQSQIYALEKLEEFDMRRWNACPLGNSPDNLTSCGAIWENLAIHTYWHLGELAGAIQRFHGTYTLNMVPHYFYRLKRTK